MLGYGYRVYLARIRLSNQPLMSVRPWRRCVSGGFGDPKVIGGVSTGYVEDGAVVKLWHFSDPKEGWTGFEACYV